MKPIKKIIFLGSVVSTIVLVWLVPGINTAKQVQYTRRFEDTDKMELIVPSDTTKTGKRKMRKFYKTETIKPEMKLSRIKPKMYSRSLQFEEVMAYDSLLLLEVDAPQTRVISIDSTQTAGVDSIASGAL